MTKADTTPGHKGPEMFTRFARWFGDPLDLFGDGLSGILIHSPPVKKTEGSSPDTADDPGRDRPKNGSGGALGTASFPKPSGSHDHDPI